MKGKKRSTEHIARESASILDDRIACLQECFPEVVVEGKIQFDKLRAALGDIADDRTERYSFTWAGKRDAMRLLQMSTRATLIPVTEESINFDTTQNLFIESDNLEAQKLIYKAYAGRVKVILIDPPYNTGNDFIYPDNFADPLDTYLKLTGQKDADGNMLTDNREKSGRYHSTWLSMMYPRLVLARQLLKDDGVIFVHIDDHEVFNLRTLMNEVFGEENFIATIVWQKIFSPKNTAKYFSEDHDYVVLYARNKTTWLPRLMPRTEDADARYSNPDNDHRGIWTSSDLTARNYYSQGKYQVKGPTGKVFGPGTGRYWRQNHEKFLELDRDSRIWWGSDGSNMPRLKRFLTDVKQGIVPQTLWTCKEVGHTQEAKKELLDHVHFGNSDNVLDTVKPVRLMQRILQIGTDPVSKDIVLDFFAGSAPTAHAVLKQNREDGGNRRFICVQIPEPLPEPEKTLKTIADIGKERIRKVIGRLKKDADGKLDLRDQSRPEDLGFKVFKLAESHYRRWTGVEGTDPEKYAETMELFTDPLLPGWKPENVLYEVMLKEGFSLTSRIEKDLVPHPTPTGKGTRKADGKYPANTVYRVTDEEKGQAFRICLDDTLHGEAVKALELTDEELFICRDIALTDELAANLALQCRLKTI